MKGLIFVLLLCPALALADSFPASYRVTGVAADDELNIRAAPDAGAALLGSYAPTRANVEVLALSDDGAWAQVPLPEGAGWVALRFLAPMPAAEGIPRPLTCLGTEPFWSVSLQGTGARYATPEADLPLILQSEVVADDGFLLATSDENDWQRTAIIARAACSDGMSDRPFGLTYTGFVAGPGGMAFVERGCCTLDGG
jgi:uncharacterized membrane protein